MRNGKNKRLGSEDQSFKESDYGDAPSQNNPAVQQRYPIMPQSQYTQQGEYRGQQEGQHGAQNSRHESEANTSTPIPDVELVFVQAIFPVRTIYMKGISTTMLIPFAKTQVHGARKAITQALVHTFPLIV